MLSYRHAFHAGNHADVLKHLVLCLVLEHLQQKDTAVMVVDTHAGRGSYKLDDASARKLDESAGGIARLWQASGTPEAVAGYLGLVRAGNPDGQLKVYPGSPAIIAAMLRPQDRARFFELHPADSGALANLFATRRRQIQVRNEDGLAGLRGVLPPPSRRALVLIDPSYEDKSEYRQILDTLADAQRRFPTGVYAIWYPQLMRRESQRFGTQLERAAGERWLHVGLRVRADPEDGFGMTGSGLVIINPPWTLAGQMRQVLPWLTATLGQDRQAEPWIRALG